MYEFFLDFIGDDLRYVNWIDIKSMKSQCFYKGDMYNILETFLAITNLYTKYNRLEAYRPVQPISLIHINS